MPYTTPLAVPTEATEVLPLLQLPPESASARVEAEPTQIDVVPVIAGITPVTVIVNVAGEPHPFE